MEYSKEIQGPFHLIRCAWELGVWAVQDMLITIDDNLVDLGDGE